MIKNDLEGKEEMNFSLLYSKFKIDKSNHRLFFKFLRKNLKYISQIKYRKTRTRKFLNFTRLFSKYSEVLLRLETKLFVQLIKKLPWNMIYDLSACLPKNWKFVQFSLLEHLADCDKGHLIKDRVLHFELVCQFEPERAKKQSDTLNISEFPRALDIAQLRKCYAVVAYICFKQGKYDKAFADYANLISGLWSETVDNLKMLQIFDRDPDLFEEGRQVSATRDQIAMLYGEIRRTMMPSEIRSRNQSFQKPSLEEDEPDDFDDPEGLELTRRESLSKEYYEKIVQINMNKIEALFEEVKSLPIKSEIFKKVSQSYFDVGPRSKTR